MTGDAVRPFLESFPIIKTMSWDIDTLETADNITFLRGWVKQTLQVDGQIQEVDGKYCDLLRRERDGQWRFAVIIWNDNRS